MPVAESEVLVGESEREGEANIPCSQEPLNNSSFKNKNKNKNKDCPTTPPHNHPHPQSKSKSKSSTKVIGWFYDFEPLSLDDYLDSDPVDNHGDASFTGVWSSAKGLCGYLEHNWNFSSGHVLELELELELGSGTGWLGVTLARNVPNIHMTLTDSSVTGVISWTKQNVQAGQKQFPIVLGDSRIKTTPLNWGKEQDLQNLESICNHNWDLVIGTDLIYSEDGIQALAPTLVSLLRLGANRILYGHTPGRIPHLDELWEQKCEEIGLQ